MCKITERDTRQTIKTNYYAKTFFKQWKLNIFFLPGAHCCCNFGLLFWVNNDRDFYSFYGPFYCLQYSVSIIILFKKQRLEFFNMYSQVTDGETQIFVGHRSVTSADLWVEGLRKIFKMTVLQMNKQGFGSINNY